MILNSNALCRCLICLLLAFAVAAQAQTGTESIHLKRLKRLNQTGAYPQTVALVDSLISTVDTDSTLANILNQKAIALSSLGKYEAALDLHQKVEALRVELFGIASLEVANSKHNQGNVLLTIEQVSSALTYLETAKDIRARQLPPNHPDLAAIYVSLGVAYQKIEEDKALSYFQKALHIKQENFGADSPKNLSALTNLANLYFQQTNFSKALKYYQTALRIQVDSVHQTHPQTALLCSNLGNCWLALGQIDSALSYQHNAVQLIEQIEETIAPSVQALCFQNLGNAYLDAADYEQALSYLQRALAVQPDVGSAEALKIQNNIGLCLKNKGKLDAAIETFETIINESVSPSSGFLASVYINLGSCLFENTWYDGALIYFEQAAAILEQLNTEKELMLIVQSKIADCAFQQQDYERSVGILQSLLDSEHLAANFRLLNYFKLGKIQASQKKYVQAVHYYNQGLKAVNYSNATKLENNQQELVAHTLTAKAESLIAQSDEQEVLKSAFVLLQQAVSIFEMIGNKFEETNSNIYLNDYFSNVFDVFVKVLYELNQYEKAFYYAEKSKASVLATLIRDKSIQRFANVPDELVEHERQLQLTLEKIEQQLFEASSFSNVLSEQVKKNYAERFEIKKELQLVRDSLTTFTPIFTATTFEQKIDIKSIQSHLQPTQTLVEYHVGNAEIFVFTITQNTFNVKALPKPINFGAQVIQLYNSIRIRPDVLPNADEFYEQYCELAFRFYQWLVEPIRADLKSEVIVVPDKLMNFLPFDVFLKAIPTTPYLFNKHDYLVHDFNFSYAYSYKLWQLMKAKEVSRTARTMLAVAPNFTGEEQLLYNIPEVKSVQKIIGGKTLTAQNAKEQYFKSAIRSAHRILHFSTHGVANEQQSNYSYLAFAASQDGLEDDKLYAAEIYNLDLNTELVFLSACQTNLGKYYAGEGLMSLTRAFTFAGAKSIISSLWSIDDQQTKFIVEETYRQLAENQKKSVALATAKRTYLRQANQLESHPYYWSALLLIGDESNLADLKTNTPIWMWGLLSLIVFGLFWKQYKTRKNKDSLQRYEQNI